MFHLPQGIVYLDGNSIAALPKGVAERVAHVVTAEWGRIGAAVAAASP